MSILSILHLLNGLWHSQLKLTKCVVGSSLQPAGHLQTLELRCRSTSARIFKETKVDHCPFILSVHRYVIIAVRQSPVALPLPPLNVEKRSRKPSQWYVARL